MKVIHFIESLGKGGAEQLLTTLLPELQRKGLEVTVAVLRGPMDLQPRLAAAGITVHRLPTRHKWRLFAAARDIARLAAEGGHDVVHAHLYFPAVITALARTINLTQVTTILTFHNLAYANGVNKAGFGMRFRRWLAAVLYPRGIDVFLGVSNAVARHYQTALGLRKVVTLHNPVNPAALNRIPVSLGRNNEVLHLVVPGRLVNEKGHTDLFKALAHLKGHGCHFHVTCAGGGPLLPDLQGELAQLGLANQVTWTGALEHEQMLDVISSADIVVVPSRFEGFGLTALEAMALGRPVLATTAGGLPEVIEDHVSGMLVSPQDPMALAQALRHLMDDFALRASLSEAGRRRAERNFSVQVIAGQLVDIYDLAASGTTHAEQHSCGISNTTNDN